MKKKLNNKGLTLVEILAVIAILGILMGIGIGSVTILINRAKKTKMNHQEKVLILAAKDYFQVNRSELPKIVGESRIITTKDLLEKNFIKDRVTDDKKIDCTDNSYIEVKKESKQGFSYKTHICETIPSNSQASTSSSILIHSITFDNYSKVVSMRIKNTDSTNIVGYAYSVSVSKDTYSINAKYFDVYNSGTININPTRDTNISISLGDNIDFSGIKRFRITILAIDENGKTNTPSSNIFSL